ncbi:serine/threonine-protein kinase STY13-like [Zingiber officinale]|uniref:serine/threonine-protein kinase STY13-like n=1 Tax=Zingiber officinale TaxID=94328 RepID=UPI001C4D6348|nr:serine/threonine-protein kinase STY13-like [Zingiber officinale]
MESGDGFLDPKWLIDPRLLFVSSKIGEGGHAKVYAGKYKNQDVAIKVLHNGYGPEEMAKKEAMFMREVTVLAQIQHKNLVKFVGAVKEPVMAVVTELLVGGSLRKYLRNMKPRSLEPVVAVGFALDIAQAIECLHSHGIIHHDLKPDNLLLTTDLRTVKLVDLGLAREATQTETRTAETGTCRWMAPELYNNVTLQRGEKKHYDHKVDVYSFGMVLWEMLSNRLPFEGMSNLQAAYAAAFKNVRPSTDDLPEELALILTSCWEEDPSTRPDFGQIVQMLLRYLSIISPPQQVFPEGAMSSQNVVLSPDSPGTSSPMEAPAVKDLPVELVKKTFKLEFFHSFNRIKLVSISWYNWLNRPARTKSSNTGVSVKGTTEKK